jgi:transketolase
LFPIADLNNLRKIDSDLEGHPTPRLNFVDVATGSLGQGLSVAAGMAYVGKVVDNAPYRYNMCKVFHTPYIYIYVKKKKKKCFWDAER